MNFRLCSFGRTSPLMSPTFGFRKKSIYLFIGFRKKSICLCRLFLQFFGLFWAQKHPKVSYMGIRTILGKKELFKLVFGRRKKKTYLKKRPKNPKKNQLSLMRLSRKVDLKSESIPVDENLLNKIRAVKRLRITRGTKWYFCLQY